MIESALYRRVLLDAGPIVAMLNPNDRFHANCVETLRRIQPPLITSWPVLAEAAWLLRKNPLAISKLLRDGGDGFMRLAELRLDELPEIDKLYQRYGNLSPQLADLTLVYIAQRDTLDTIFTLDRRDFSVYRRKGKQGFRLLPED